MAPILPGFSLTTIVIVYAATFAVGAAGLVWVARRLEPVPDAKRAPLG
jgi:hypothetical protein